MRSRSCSRLGLVFGLAVAIAGYAAGAHAADALLLGVPGALPMLLDSMPAPRRRRFVRVQLPCLAVLAVAAGLWLGAGLAHGQDAPLPFWSSLRYSLLLLGWLLLLRCLQAACARLAAAVVRGAVARAWLGGALTVLVGFPNLYVALQTHRIAVDAPVPADHLPARTVAFAAGDGIALAGTLLQQPASAAPDTPVVVVCHGLGANRAAFFGWAELAWRLGCHALAFDFRAHGASGGFTSTFTSEEVFDVAGAVGWLRGQDAFAQAPIVLVGVSLGAATALRAAAIVGASAVLAESAFADLESMVAQQAAPLGPLRGLAVALVGAAAWCQLGVSLGDVSPRASLASLPAAVPVVLVHAGDDRVIPLAEGERLAAVRPGLVLHVVAGAPHGGCLAFDPDGMRERLRELLDAVRAAHPSPAPSTGDSTGHSIGSK